MENQNDRIIKESQLKEDGKISTQDFRSEARFWMPLGRIYWPAIFAGVLVTVVTQMLLSLLGVGIGLASINPTAETDPARGLGTGSIIWWSISMLISLFAGGWAAGRFYPVRQRAEVSFHGLLTWSLFTVFSFLMLTTSLGMLVSGAGNIIGTAITASASAAERGDFSGINSEINELLRGGRTSSEAIKPWLEDVPVVIAGVKKMPYENQTAQPDDRNKAGNITGQSRESNVNRNNQTDGSREGAENRKQSKSETGTQKGGGISLIAAAREYLRGDANNLQARERLVTALMNQTGMTLEEANARVEQWTVTYNEIREQAKVRADEAAKTVSTASIIGFFALIIGALVTMLGARVGNNAEFAPVKTASEV